MKTVCFDLRALQIGHENRGIGMFVKSLLNDWPDSDYRYIFYAFKNGDPLVECGIIFKHEYEVVYTPRLKTILNSPRDLFSLLRLVYHRFKPIKTFRPDIFVQFDFTLGAPSWRRTKVAIVGYDLIPLIMKGDYLPSPTIALRSSATTLLWTPFKIVRSLSFRVSHLSFSKTVKPTHRTSSAIRALLRSTYYRFKYNLHYKTYKKADRIICISKATAEDFANILSIDERRISHVPLAAVLGEEDPDLGLAKSISKPYVFYIGGTDTRKRVADIVNAFNIARGRGVDISLVFAGNEFSNLKKLPDLAARLAIASSPYKNDIHLLGFVNDAQKKGLLNNALVFVFCTMYEGFGLPILEAMASSCPVISYANSSIKETAGTAALLVRTGDYVGVAEQIQKVYNDKKLREALIKSGLKQSDKFSWSKTARGFLSSIDNTLS